MAAWRCSRRASGKALRYWGLTARFGATARMQSARVQHGATSKRRRSVWTSSRIDALQPTRTYYVSRNQPYTLCQNLRWLLCAVQGKLPHQKGKELHFASAPKDVDWNVWDDPARGDAWWPEPHESSFAVSDVFFVELALLNALCKNADELFRVEVGETFVCELVKENAFKRVVRVLV